MIVEVIVTRKGKTYVRIFTAHMSLFYEQAKCGDYDRCPPPPPPSLAMGRVEQRTFYMSALYE